MRVFSTLLIAFFGIITTAVYAQNSYDISTITVTDTVGFLYDDGGPSANYSNNRIAEFTINVGAGKTLNLQWQEFNIETNEAGQAAACIYDYVEVFNGPATPASPMRYCGTALPPNFQVTSGMITIRFTSDGAAVFPGFKAYWTTGALPVPPPTGYCAASGPICAEPFSPRINSVDVDGLTYTNNTCNDDPSSGKAYTAYLDSIFPMESSVASIVTVSNSNGTDYEQVDVYVDWNNNGIFEAGTETYNGVLSDLAVYTIAVLPPAGEMSGNKRMRVRVWDQVFQTGVVDACGESEYGEVEDYTVFYIDTANPIPSCASGFIPAEGASNVCIKTILKWNAAVNASGYKVTLKENGTVTLLNEQLTTDTQYDVSALISPGKSYSYFILPTSDNGDATGCDTIHFTTAANPDPAANILPVGNPVQACINTPFNINGNPSNGTTPFTHLWTGNGTVYLNSTTISAPDFTGNIVGTFTLAYRVTDANNCSSSDTVQVQVISEANGGTISYTGPSAICQGTKSRFKVVGSSGNITLQDSLVGGNWANIATTKINDSIYEVSENLIGVVYFRTSASGTNCSAFGTNTVSVTVNPAPAAPIVVNIGSDTICSGQSTTLVVTNYSSNLTWNDASSTQNDTLVVTSSGDYVVTYSGASCPAFSAVSKVLVAPNPIAPINNVGSLTACADKPPLLFTTIQTGETVLWNTGATTKDILANASGNYAVTVTNAFGCVKTSNTLVVTINPLPPKPLITTTGSANPCEGEPVMLSSSYTSGNTWSTGANTESIVVNSGGRFWVTYSNFNGCMSTSDTLDLTFRPAPAKPTVSVAGNPNTCIGDSVKLSVSTPSNSTWNDAANTVSNTLVVYTNGNYFAQFVNTDGCQVYSDTVAVRFTQFQATPIITLTGSLCEGNTVLLTSSLKQGNTWNDLAQTQNDSLYVTEGGSYAVQNIANGVCVANSAPYTVTFEPRPAQPSIYEFGDSLFSSVLGFSYQWISDKGVVENSNHYAIKPTFTSNYQVIVYSEIGCSSALSADYYKGFTGIEELTAAGIVIFPNPFRSELKMIIEGTGTHTYNIINQLGQVMQSGTLSPGLNVLSTDFASGIYLVEITNDTGVFKSKLIKQ